MKLVPVESGICETGIRRTAKHAEFRCHKRPGLPCQPSSPKSPPLSRRCEEEGGRSERKKGWFVRGRNLVSDSQREERNVKKTRIGRKEVKVTSTKVQVVYVEKRSRYSEGKMKAGHLHKKVLRNKNYSDSEGRSQALANENREVHPTEVVKSKSRGCSRNEKRRS